MSEAVTMVKGGIHNPDDARHFMRLARPEYPVSATIGSTEIARSTRAVKLKEVGFDIYDSVIYFPREDVDMSRLEKNTRSTHCPLKGDTEYFDIKTDAGSAENAAWSYDRTIAIASEIKDLIAFDAKQVQVVEHTVER